MAGADFAGRHNRLWQVEQPGFGTPRHPFGEYHIRKTAWGLGCVHATGGGTVISRTEREIELLREYRTRLTADVVTGKLDVRQAAERLPAETEYVDFYVG